MLERGELLLRPWQKVASEPNRHQNGHSNCLPMHATVRTVEDPASRIVLGVIRGRCETSWPLFPWLNRRSWQVLETEDESLLQTVDAPWGFIRPWQVRDSDDRLICSIRSTAIYDGSGNARAVLSFDELATTNRFVSMDSEELARVFCNSAGAILEFTAATRYDPFAKMALLGATLALEDRMQRVNEVLSTAEPARQAI